MSIPSFNRAVTCAVLALALVPVAFAAAPAAPVKEPGDLWEVTSKMSMEGMPMQMPARTSKVCSPKTWTEPPGVAADEKCTMTDVKNTSTKSTWRMTCPGPPAMTGEGEIIRTSPEAYTGKMKFTSEEGVMTMALSGRRVGDCDSAASRRLVAQQQAQMETQMAQAEAQSRDAVLKMCAETANSLNLSSMQAQGAICDEAAMKAAFCQRLESEAGFKTVCNDEKRPPTSLADAAAYCGKDPDSMRKKACDDAMKKEDLDLIGNCCPDQSREIAQKECAGMKYTSAGGSKYAAFCVTYAADVMDGTQQQAAPAQPKKKKGFKIPWPH